MFIHVIRAEDGVKVWINVDNVLGIEPGQLDGATISFPLITLEAAESPYMIIARIREQENLR